MLRVPVVFNLALTWSSLSFVKMLQFDDNLEQSSNLSLLWPECRQDDSDPSNILNEESDRNQNVFRAKERKRISIKEWEEQGQG